MPQTKALGALSGSRASHRANSSVVSTKGFDPERVRRKLERIEAIATKPGKYSGPAFDEIAALVASCLASIRED